ncbi:MAG: hypothetical protein PVF91_05320 [Chromatiales bacterium]|jgi:hypothetical protein
MRIHQYTGGLCLLAATRVFALDITTHFADRGVGVGLPEGRDCLEFAVGACDVEQVIIENGVPVFVPYAACGHDADLIDHMQAAATHWEDIIEDDHDLTVHFWWVADSAPTTHIMQTDAEGRPTEAAICLPADLSWYYDPLPGNDDEFELGPKLYRSLHPDERAEALLGDPPEVFEIAYNGPRTSGSGALDMLTVALHELGHAVGLAPSIAGDPPVIACTDPDPFYDLASDSVAGTEVSLKAYEFVNGNTNMTDWDCGHLALGGIKACRTAAQQAACDDGDDSTPCPNSTSTLPSSQPPYTVGYCLQHQALMWFGQLNPASFRQRPEMASILAIREAADWEHIDLPRKFTLAPGQWQTPDIWLGGRAPDGGDDVFVVNQFTDIELNVFTPRSARSLTVTDGNLVRILFAQLDLDGAAHVRQRLPGEDDLILPPPDPGDIGTPPEITRLEVDGSTLNAAAVHVGTHGRLDVGFNGAVRATELTNAEEGELRGRGLVRTDHLVNRGLITSNGEAQRFETITEPGGIVVDAPEFDLDGSSPDSQDARLRALTGDLIFDGPLSDPVNAEIQVGSGHELVFTEGWTQASALGTDQHLALLGGSAGATVVGPSTLAGRVESQGIGRFTSPAVLTAAAQLNLDIGGVVPGTDHDQIQFQQSVALAGTLSVQLEEGYLPEPGDEFVILTYGSRTGEFAVVNGLEITPDRQFVLHYEPAQARLVVLSVLQGDDDGGVVHGGKADEILKGGEGNDVLVGGAGNDILIGGPGDDVLVGGPGDDVLQGNEGDDLLQGQSGMDHLDGGPDSDTCNGGPGTDSAVSCEAMQAVP